MSGLSHKQGLFRDYLLKKIGFINDTFLIKYIFILEKNSPRLSLLGKVKKIWKEDEQIFYPENTSINKKYIESENYFIPENFNIIDLLNIELDIRKNNDYSLKNIQLEIISATDISNYTYCPVSFAISKTFELPKLESTLIGSLLHEKNKLIHYIKPFKVRQYEFLEEKYIEVEKTLRFELYLDENNRLFFEELKDSIIIFYGHNTLETNKYFKSNKGNYVGQPDYIFKNEKTNHFFVIEEKFQYIPNKPSVYNNFITDKEKDDIQKKRLGKPFFSNHINQLNSYIHGIDEYELKYGYLIYWQYELNNGEQRIVSCKVLRIDKTEKGRTEIREVFISIKNLINNKAEKFDINSRVPSKCANCISNLLCGHKSGMFNSFTIPYSKNYLKVNYAPFPKELIKPKLPNENDEGTANP